MDGSSAAGRPHLMNVRCSVTVCAQFTGLTALGVAAPPVHATLPQAERSACPDSRAALWSTRPLVLLSLSAPLTVSAPLFAYRRVYVFSCLYTNRTPRVALGPLRCIMGRIAYSILCECAPEWLGGCVVEAAPCTLTNLCRCCSMLVGSGRCLSVCFTGLGCTVVKGPLGSRFMVKAGVSTGLLALPKAVVPSSVIFEIEQCGAGGTASLAVTQSCMYLHRNYTGRDQFHDDQIMDLAARSRRASKPPALARSASARGRPPA